MPDHSADKATSRPLAVGDVLHGMCGGHFGHHRYDCCRIEVVGPDWIVARDEYGALSFAAGRSLMALRRYRQQSQWCPAAPCPCPCFTEPSLSATTNGPSSSLDEVLRIVAAWCVTSNDGGGVDAGDLAGGLERAGYPLPAVEEDDDA
ncbi:hypothetical protein [Streptomyces sp. URMC 124]|uniref:hypothetical protein n=1 Tax=Streptomyces sp. URMC 124 TaxID=3423405 RepID=UPI003F1D8CBE